METWGKRSRGRPRLRWLDDVRGDLRRLGVRNCKGMAARREEWRQMLEEAKILKGL